MSQHQSPSTTRPKSSTAHSQGPSESHKNLLLSLSNCHFHSIFFLIGFLTHQR
jgi:hypothetical protein